jgi:hypothetical protein
LGTPQAPQDEAKTGTALPQLGHSLLSICGFRCASPNSAKMTAQFNHLAEYSGISARTGRAWNHIATEVQH